MHAARYTNPVHPRPFADPCVVTAADRYLAVGAGAGGVGRRSFEVLSSPDLVRWRSLGSALEALPEGAGSEPQAPDVTPADDGWSLHYAVRYADGRRGVRSARSPSVTGPYTDRGADLTPDEPDAGDPAAVTTRDGRRFLLLARAGGIAVLPLAPDGGPGGSVSALLGPAAGTTLYGPSVVSRRGRLHLLHTVRRPGGAGLLASVVVEQAAGRWSVRGTPVTVLRPHPVHVPDVGRGRVTASPGGDVLVYAALDRGRSGPRLHVDPVRWTVDGPVVDGPTWWETSLGR